jgi:hypothetical protein
LDDGHDCYRGRRKRQGDEVEAKQILKDFRRAARHAGLTPEEFSDNCVKHLRDGRLLSEGWGGQEMQMMGVVWRILETETNDPEHLASSLITSAIPTSTSTLKCMAEVLRQL